MIVEVRTLRFGELSVECEGHGKVRALSFNLPSECDAITFPLTSLSFESLTGLLAERRNCKKAICQVCGADCLGLQWEGHTRQGGNFKYSR